MKVTLIALQPLDGVYGLIPEGETFETAPGLAKELIGLGLAKEPEAVVKVAEPAKPKVPSTPKAPAKPKQEKAPIQTKEEKNASPETK
jgi:hypothetical protein